MISCPAQACREVTCKEYWESEESSGQHGMAAASGGFSLSFQTQSDQESAKDGRRHSSAGQYFCTSEEHSISPQPICPFCGQRHKCNSTNATAQLQQRSCSSAAAAAQQHSCKHICKDTAATAQLQGHSCNSTAARAQLQQRNCNSKQDTGTESPPAGAAPAGHSRVSIA